MSLTFLGYHDTFLPRLGAICWPAAKKNSRPG